MFLILAISLSTQGNLQLLIGNLGSKMHGSDAETTTLTTYSRALSLAQSWSKWLTRGGRGFPYKRAWVLVIPFRGLKSGFGTSGVQGWRSGESTRLPPMWPRFDSSTWRHMWVEFVGSLLCTERFSPGTPVFPLLKNQHLTCRVNC